VKPVRYSYGITAALLAGGAAISIITGVPAGAQVAQNDAREMRSVVPRAGAPESFAELTEQLAPAVVNISTRQRSRSKPTRSPARRSRTCSATPGRRRRPADHPRGAVARLGLHVSADGYVVTNNHVIQPDGSAELEEVTVTMPDGTEYTGRSRRQRRRLGPRGAQDRPHRAVPVRALRRLQDGPRWRLGDRIGNPFGLGGTVTSGIVSAV
jgi:serine protease Do